MVEVGDLVVVVGLFDEGNMVVEDDVVGED